jgi:hypothetical protein
VQKKAARERKETVHEVTVVRPNPVLWKAALAQAGGDAKRIEIISPTNLVVHPPRR